MLLHLITSTNASPCSPIMQFVHYIGCHKVNCAAGYKWSYEPKTSWLLTAQFYVMTSITGVIKSPLQPPRIQCWSIYVTTRYTNIIVFTW